MPNDDSLEIGLFDWYFFAFHENIFCKDKEK